MRSSRLLTGFLLSLFLLQAALSLFLNPVLGLQKTSVNSLQSIGREVLASSFSRAFMLQAHKFNRITNIAQLSNMFPEPSISKCSVLGYGRLDSIERLFCLLDQIVYMPYSGSGLVLENNSVVKLPLGDSIIITLADVLSLYAATGRSSVENLFPIDNLYRYMEYAWGEMRVLKGGEEYKIEFSRHHLRGPPDALAIIYSQHLRTHLRDTSSPLSKALPLHEFSQNYHSLLKSVTDMAIKKGFGSQLPLLADILVEWRIEGDSAYIYPVYFSDTVRISDLGPSKDPYTRVKAFGLYSGERWTSFPVIQPLPPVESYNSIYSIYSPVESLAENTVVIAPSRGSLGKSFRLVVSLYARNGEKLVSFTLNFKVASEAWWFLKKGYALSKWGKALLEGIDPDKILAEWMRYVGISIGLPSVSTPTPIAKAASPSQHTSASASVTLNAISAMYVEPRVVSNGKIIGSRGGSTSVYYTGSYSLEDYGEYGEAIINSWFKYKFYSTETSNACIDKRCSSEIYVSDFTALGKAVLRGGGALPFPSPYLYSDSISLTGFLGPLAHREQYSLAYNRIDEGIPVFEGTSILSHRGTCMAGEGKYPAPECSKVLPSSVRGYSSLGFDSNYYSYTYTYEARGVASSPIPRFVIPLGAKPAYTSSDKKIVEGVVIEDLFNEYKLNGEKKIVRKGVHDHSYTTSSCTILWEGTCKETIHYPPNATVWPRVLTCYYGVAVRECAATLVSNSSEWSSGWSSPSYPFIFTQKPINAGKPPGVSTLSVRADREVANPSSTLLVDVAGIIDDEPAAGVKVEIKALLNGREFWKKQFTLDENGKHRLQLIVPSEAMIARLTGVNLTSNTSKTVRLSLIAVTLTGKPLIGFEQVDIGYFNGVVGSIVNIDFDVVRSVEPSEIRVPFLKNLTLLSLHGSMLTIAYYDPNLHPEGGEPGDYYLSEHGFKRAPSWLIWDPKIYLSSMLGEPVKINIVFLDEDNNNTEHHIPVSGITFKARLPTGNFSSYAEIIIGEGNNTQVFRTEKLDFELKEGDIAVLDFYVPIAPILRAIELTKELREWKITNSDLALLLESIPDLLVWIKEKGNSLFTAYLNTCSELGDPVIDPAISDGNAPHLCEGIAGLKAKYEKTSMSEAYKDIREVSVKLATIGVEFRSKAIESFIRETFLEPKHLPPYETRKALLDPKDPWHKLFMIEMFLSYLANRKEHIKSQIVLSVKYMSMLASLQVVNYIVANKLFLIDKHVQGPIVKSIASKLSQMGELGKWMLDVSDRFAGVQVVLKATQILLFTFVGETLNLEPLRRMIIGTLREHGYRGVEIGYHIAAFFKVIRFVVSATVRSLDTDVAFEITFQILNQVLGYAFLKYTVTSLSLATNVFSLRVIGGKYDKNLYDSMKAITTADDYANMIEATLELVAKTLAPIKNAFRGLGGFMEYISGIKFVKGVARLDSKWAAKIGLTKSILSKGFAELSTTIYSKLPSLKQVSSLGGRLKNWGMSLAYIVVGTTVLDYGVLEPYLALLVAEYSTKTSIKRSVFTSIVESIYGPTLTALIETLIESRHLYTTSRATLSGGETLAPETKPQNTHKRAGRILFEPYTSPAGLEETWPEASTMARLVDQLLEGVKTYSCVNATALAELMELRSKLNTALTKRYLVALSKNAEQLTEADKKALAMLGPYREATEKLIQSIMLYTTSPEAGYRLAEYFGSQVKTVLSEIAGIDRPSQPISGEVYSIIITPHDYRNGTLELIIKPIGNPPANARLHLLGDGVKISKNVYEVDLSSETSIKISYSTTGKTAGFIDVELEAGGRIAASEKIPVSLLEDLVEPWTYTWKNTKIYSIGPLEVRDLGGNTAELGNVGTNIVAIVSDKWLEITSRGTLHYSITDYQDRKVYLLVAENTTLIKITARETPAPKPVSQLAPTTTTIQQHSAQHSQHSEQPQPQPSLNPLTIGGVAVAASITTALAIRLVARIRAK